jgi:hypothetical protein
MAGRRRWLQFSLRGFLVLLTALAVEELAKRFEEPTKVLISAKKVDPLYLEMYKPGTIQMIVPASVLKEPIKGQQIPYSTDPDSPFYRP